jgi:hypothetical protein
MRAFLMALVCGLGAATLQAKEKPPSAYTIPLPPKPNYSDLDWLVGEWSGKTTSPSPEGDVRLSVAFALENRYLILKEDISLAGTKTAPASRESWMGVLSADPSGDGFSLRAFSSTGFITRYRVTVNGPEIHFNPEGGDQPPPGWLFRRVIQRVGATEISESVQAAPPNKLFFDYYSARLTRLPSQPANPPQL